MPHKPPSLRPHERGNVLLIVFFAIALIAALTAAIQGSNRSETASTDSETMLIRVGEAQRYASEVERAVMFIMQNGFSESDIRFAHPDASTDYGDLGADSDPTDQIFHPNGGGATYRDPPSGVNDGSPWEFYGGSHIPGMGSERAELTIVLPNVTPEFCAMVNDMNGQNGTPTDTGAGSASGSNPGSCVYHGNDGRFNDSQQFYDSPNTLDEASFEQDDVYSHPKPAPQACVVCSVDGANHFYHVLMTR